MKNIKAKSSVSIILAIILMVAFSFSVLFFSNNFKNDPAIAIESTSQTSDEIKFNNIDINEEFDESSVLVVMDNRIGKINKIHNDSYFGKFPKKYIKDLTYITGNISDKEYLDVDNFRQILKIELQEKSKKNVINVIKQLEKIDGILWAGPN